MCGWVGRCGHACVYAGVCVLARGLFLDFKLLKGALCAAISLWDSGIGSGAQKQSSLFISWKASEQVSQSESMTNGWRGKERESESFGMCITELWCGVDRYYYTLTYCALATLLFSHCSKTFYSSLFGSTVQGTLFTPAWAEKAPHSSA